MSREHFEDIDLESIGFGGLGGLAADNLTKSTAKTTPGGVDVKLNCGNCGVPSVMTIEWPEAIVLSAGAIPPGWKYINGHIHPTDVRCKSCVRNVSPGVTPDEAKRWVTAGVNARFVNPALVQTILSKVRQG